MAAVLFKNECGPKVSTDSKTHNNDISVLTVSGWHQDLVKQDGQPGINFKNRNTPILSFNLLSCVSTEKTTLSGNFC